MEEPADWVNSMVVAEKPLKPKTIKRLHYVIPTTEEILSNMGGAKKFTKLVASNAY